MKIGKEVRAAESYVKTVSGFTDEQLVLLSKMQALTQDEHIIIVLAIAKNRLSMAKEVERYP